MTDNLSLSFRVVLVSDRFLIALECCQIGGNFRRCNGRVRIVLTYLDLILCGGLRDLIASCRGITNHHSQLSLVFTRFCWSTKLLNEHACVWTVAALAYLRLLMLLVLMLLHSNQRRYINMRLFEHLRRAAQDVFVLSDMLNLRL